MKINNSNNLNKQKEEGKKGNSSNGLLFDAQSLKSLLNIGGNISGNNGDKKRKVKIPQSNEHKVLFQSIVSEETGMDAKRLKKARKKNQKILSATLIHNNPSQQVVWARETVHNFGKTWGCPANDIKILDNQFSNIRFQTETAINKILYGYEAAVSRNDGLLTIEDASMLISYAELDFDHATFQKSCIKSLVHNNQNNNNNEGDNKNNSPSTYNSTSIRPSSPEHQMAETLVQNLMKQHNLQLIDTNHHLNYDITQDLTQLLYLDKWIAYIKSAIRLKHMQDLLAQRKGIITIENSVGMNNNNNNVNSNGNGNGNGSIISARTKNFQSQRSQSQNSLLLNDNNSNSNNNNNFLLSSSPSSYSKTLADLNSVMVKNPTEVGSPLRTHSQPSSTSVPSIDLNDSSTSRLAPLRMKRQKRLEDKHHFFQSSGFDQGFGRETPRCLRPGEGFDTTNNNNNNGMNNGKWEMIRELKRELQIAREGLAQIDHAMAENITWVQANCDMKGMGGKTLSQRAIKQCRKISAERFLEIFDSIRLSALYKAFQKLVKAVKLSVIAITSKDYSRAKSIEIFSHIISNALQRQYKKMFAPWLLRMKWERRWEQEAGAIEIGRVIRGYIARRRVWHIIRHRNSIIIQCAIRVYLSKCRVYHRRMAKIIREAANAIIVFFRGLVAVSKAKAIVQFKRETKAAIKIQSLQRGIMARERCKRIRSQQALMKRSAIIIQKIYRSKIKAKNRIKQRKKELEEQAKRLVELHQKEMKIKNKAAIVIQCFIRRVLAKIRVQKIRKQKRYNEMAKRIQNLARRVAETKPYKEMLKERKRQKDAAIALQALQRGRSLRKELQENNNNNVNVNVNVNVNDNNKNKDNNKDQVSRPQSASILDQAAVRLQSLYRGGVARDQVRQQREEKKKNAPKLFNRTNTSPGPNTIQQQSSLRFMGFKSKLTITNNNNNHHNNESDKPKTPKSGSFMGFLKGNTSKDHEEKQRPGSAMSNDSDHSSSGNNFLSNFMRTSSRDGNEKEHQEDTPPTAIGRMLSIVKSNSKDELDSPAKTLSKSRQPSFDLIPPDEHDILLPSSSLSNNSNNLNLNNSDHGSINSDNNNDNNDNNNQDKNNERLNLSPVNEGINNEDNQIKEGEIEDEFHQELSPNNNNPPTIDIPSSTIGDRPGTGSRSSMSPFPSIGKKLFGSKPETPTNSKGMAKSPSFFGSLSRPSSQSSSRLQTETDESNNKLTTKSPSFLRSLSTTLFGDDKNKLEKSSTPISENLQNNNNNNNNNDNNKIDNIELPSDPIELRRYHAATRIQRFIRVSLSRRRVLKQKQKIQLIQSQAGQWVLWAAVSIQRIVRGKLGKLRFKRKLKEKEEEKKRNDKLAREKTKLDAEEKARLEDEEEIRNIVKFQAYGKSEKQKKDTESDVNKSDQQSTPSKSKDKEKDKEKEKKKKKKVHKSDDGTTSKSSSRPTTAADDDVTIDSSITNNDNNETRPSTAISEAAVAEQLKRLEDIEKSMKEKEQRMLEAAKLAEEKAAAMERALEMMEKRAKEEEFERSQRRKFLEMAAGSLSGSPYSSVGSVMNSRQQPPPASSRLNSSRAPPSARSARDGTPRPKELLKVTVGGVDWIQLWDPAESAWYWYCEASGAAQWEQPTEQQYQQYQQEYYQNDQSGYESGGAMTDYSTDNYESGNESYGTETFGPWQEYWDESAQAKYWYNNETGEASWTIPEEFNSTSNSTSGSVTAGTNSGYGDWVSYIDEATGQEYWYNPTTGETSWG